MGPALMDDWSAAGMSGAIAFRRAEESVESAVSLANVGLSCEACISVTLLF